MASFNGKVIDGRLNLRSTCSTSSSSPIQIPNGTSIVVETVSGQHAWFATSYGGHDGYVVAEFVAISSDGGTCTVSTSSGSLNIRKTPSTSAAVLFTAAKNSTLRLLDIDSVNGWFRVSSSEGTGWASSDYLTIVTEPDGSTGGGTGGDSGSGGGTGVNTATWEQVLAGTATYRRESSSSAVCEGVKTLQTYLKAIGYGSDNVGNIVVDGNFGSITEAAVKYFQAECDLDDDGVVGSDTSNRLVQAQTEAIFTNENYFPLKSSLFTYNTYPYSESSLVARIICAEHGYEGTGHWEGRIGVAKVLKNRKDLGGVTLYDNSKPRNYKNIIFGRNQYTTASSPMAYRVRRGSTAFQESVNYANIICAGNTPSGAADVTNQLFQKGYSADSSVYRSKPDYCKYPKNTTKYSFFYNED